mgnify:CR=1 FL=1
MTKTSQEVINEALRMIEVVAVDEAATADEHARAKSHLEGIFAELDETYGLAPEWTIETVPDRLFLPLSSAVAGSVCTSYGKAEYAPLRPQGIGAIMRDELGNAPRVATEATYF